MNRLLSCSVAMPTVEVAGIVPPVSHTQVLILGMATVARLMALGVIGSLFLVSHHLYAAPNTQLVGVVFSSVNSPFYAIDKASGSKQQIGLTGALHLNSLAQNSAGVLYSTGGPFPTNRMFTINAATGLSTFVTFTFGGNDDFRALAFSADDTLYGIAEGNPDSLVTINVGTGIVSVVGHPGIEGIQSLDFAPDGTLYGWDTAGLGLVTINPATGQVTDVNAAIGGDSSIQGIAFDSDGVLYGARQSLYTINLTTGNLTLVGTGGLVDVRGLEFITIPEPSTLLLLGIGAISLLGYRKAESHGYHRW
jgi:hypothetical protein